MTTLITQSPDPETAVRAVFAKLPTTSEILQRQWRKTVTDVWASNNPHIPLLLNLPLTISDVSDTPALRDTHAFLETLSEQPAGMQQEKEEWLLDSQAIHRLGSRLPSFQGQHIFHLEHEWGYPTLRRVRAVLELLRLVRRIKGQLHIVRSRYKKFTALPAMQQFYLLWHADTYHLNWAVYGGMWGDYVRVVQEYLPLLWELTEGTTTTMMPQDIAQWSTRLLEAYYPLWEQEDVLDSQKAGILSLVQRHYLPAVLSTVVLRDLLCRYGLVFMEGEFFIWTDLGTTLLTAERNQEIPCGLELLS